MDASAKFVVVRLLGAAVALGGGAVAGPLFIGTACAASASSTAAIMAAGAACVISGALTAALGWNPRLALRLLVAGLVVGTLAAVVAGRWALSVQADREMQALEELRSIAEAVEAHRAAGGALPDSGPLTRLRSALGEAEPYLYERDGDRFALLARGRCGRLDGPDWRAYVPGATRDDRADLLFTDAGFVRYPCCPPGVETLSDDPPPR
jgi:type II secretory pathway pseudopilin PulG